MNDGYRDVNVNDITWIQGDGNCSKIHLTAGRPLTITRRLGSLLQSLDKEIFVRVHKSYAVNVNYVTRHNGELKLFNGGFIPIGRDYWDKINCIFGSTDSDD